MWVILIMNNNDFEVVEKAVNIIMNPMGNYTIRNDDNVFVRSDFSSNEDYELVGIYNSCGDYNLNNITRLEVYWLDADAKRSLPTKINEREYIKALDLIFTVYDKDKYGVNIHLAKDKSSDTYSAVRLEIVSEDEVYVF